ncbi:MAG: glutaredoxin [Candidatus Poribacteria bacterium]
MAEETRQDQPVITAWMKPTCGWSNGVRAVLAKYDLSYEDRDIINVPANYREMVNITGQGMQPSLRVGDTVLADVSGEEVEQWLIDSKVVAPLATDDETPIDEGCADHGAPTATSTSVTFGS